MKVLIIPEDPTNDQYILKPVVERLFETLGKRPRIEVLQDPHLRGVDQALDSKTLQDILADNPMVDLFLLIIDRDCNRMGNTARARDREAEFEKLMTCLAEEELEVWMLALHSHSNPWKEIRRDCDPKETYAIPFLEGSGWATEVGGGYKRAMKALGQNFPRLMTLCPELKQLQDKLRAFCIGEGQNG